MLKADEWSTDVINLPLFVYTTVFEITILKKLNKEFLYTTEKLHY